MQYLWPLATNIRLYVSGREIRWLVCMGSSRFSTGVSQPQQSEFVNKQSYGRQPRHP